MYYNIDNFSFGKLRFSGYNISETLFSPTMISDISLFNTYPYEKYKFNKTFFDKSRKIFFNFHEA